jgi:hypothetical protein
MTHPSCSGISGCQMRKLIIAGAAVILCLSLVIPRSAQAGVFDSVAPGPPAGYTLTYSHDFTTQGQGDWVVQPGAGAQVTMSTRFGLGIGMDQTNEWAEAILGNGSNYLVGPNSFIEALVYIPPGSGTSGTGAEFPVGSSANWPAFWTTGQNWPADGEIDALEVQHGRSCEQTHYGTNGEQSSVSNCGPLGADSTGWLTLSIGRSSVGGEHVYEWYTHGTTVVPIGTVPLPTEANEELIFQNQSFAGDCPNCFGPTVLGNASIAWLSNVKVYNK